MRAILIMLAIFGWVADVAAQRPPNLLPKVAQHAEPVYPQIARMAHIEGDVRVRITTNGESVIKAKAETGPALLRKASEDNVRTWKFGSQAPGVFHVTFEYRLVGDQANIFLPSPDIVEVLASEPTLHITWGWISLGTWRAHLKSAHGALSTDLDLSFSGPNGEWLRVDVGGGEEDNDDYGSIDHASGMVTFTKKLKQPDGQDVTTVLVGKMKVKNIVGSFVDDTGVRGEWEAVRVR